jgi:putative endonuclease
LNKSEPAHLKRGKWAENEARHFLIQQGLKLICRNYSCQFGEIDIIMKHQDILVFIEVRFRKSNRYGSAAESITAAKQTKILNTANHYLVSNHHKGPIRFDAVTISPDKTGQNCINWINNAFHA